MIKNYISNMWEICGGPLAQGWQIYGRVEKICSTRTGSHASFF